MSMQPGAPGAQLTVTTTEDGDRIRLAAVGEVDLSTSDQLRTALLTALGKAKSGVVLDLSGVSFLDSTGIGALVHAHNQAVMQGRELAIVDPQPTVRRVLDITGVLTTLTPPPANPQRLAHS
jgi:anti-anti-sigma factor